jgi:hypothetical protein
MVASSEENMLSVRRRCLPGRKGKTATPSPQDEEVGEVDDLLTSVWARNLAVARRSQDEEAVCPSRPV